MSNPTTPFSWQMPTATDLVTDLPADFEVFGQAVATSMADLLGGTTGQVLSKTSNADMDFTWVTDPGGDITGVTAGTGISGGGTSGTVTVTNDMATTITTAGDLIYGTGSGTYTRRAIGSTGNVLTVSGGVPTWAAPASGGKVLQVVSTTKSDTFTTTSSTYVDVTGLSAVITPSSVSSKILVIYDLQPYADSATHQALFQLVRGSTAIKIGDAAGGREQITGADASRDYYNPSANTGGSYYDAPATTSATTYKIQIKRAGGISSDIACVNRGELDDVSRFRTASTITVMEIGA